VTRPGRAALAAYFLRLGAIGFGGPIALVGYMQRDLVETRGWLTADEFTDGLALSQLAPGPLAAQLAMYVGWLGYGTAGAVLTGTAFVLPSFLMVLGLGAGYQRYHGLAWMQGAFYGIGAAVIAIIARSAVKLMRVTLRTDRLLWALCALTAVVTVVTGREIVSLVVASGLVTMALRSRPMPARASTAAGFVLPWSFGALVAGTGVPHFLVYFGAAGLLVFGSGLAIVPFLHGGVVQQFHWLTESQFLDAVAVSMITPGPVVITVAFIGFLVRGMGGAVAAAAGVFAPPLIVVVVAAPYFQRLRRHSAVAALVQGVTAAATGAIAGAAVVLGRRALVDAGAIALAALALGALLLRRRLPEPALIAAAAIAGIAFR